MNKSELESKHLSELHVLAAEAGVERYRMLPRAELIEKLAGGKAGGESKPPSGPREPRQRGGREERPRKEGREEKPRGGGRQRRPRREESREGGRARKERSGREPKQAPRAQEQAPREQEPVTESPRPEPVAGDSTASARPKRKRRRRRWGRRSKGVRVHDLLLPATSGRQAIVYGESRESCTTLLRGLAAELADAPSGPDPIALLVDPTPEELADWRREAPKAEIVAAGQARHADDAIAQATLRANGGEDVVVLIDSLSRFTESYGDADGAKDLFDAGRSAAGKGSLTVVAAVERSS